LHGDGIMLGRVTDDHAELTTFTAVNDYFGYHLGWIEVEAVGLRAIHNAEPAPLLGHAFLVDDLRYVIHANWFLLSLRRNGRIADPQLILILLCPFTGDVVGRFHRC